MCRKLVNRGLKQGSIHYFLPKCSEFDTIVDFTDPIKTLLNDGKKVILFATAGRVARELNDLVKEGLYIRYF